MKRMSEELETSEELIEAGPVRPLPVRSQGRTIEIWGREVGPLAVGAPGGAAPRRARINKKDPTRQHIHN
jgi:hypothetical protein